jgi:REase_MTES_1575
VHDIAALLGPAGTASTAALAREVDRTTVSRWVASGRLVRLHPGWVALPEMADDRLVRARAAVGYSGGVLSHLTALALLGVVDVERERLDVTVEPGRRVRSGAGVQVHRSRRPVGRVVRVRGLPVTSLARALVDGWGQAHRPGSGRLPEVARAGVLRAARDRGLTAEAIRAELDARSELPGRADLVRMLELVAQGCHSELEILGAEHVLEVPGLPPAQRQYPVWVRDGRPLRIDAAWPEVKVAVELDGAAFHSSKDAWQRTLRRDAALAALGWVVLRFSYWDVVRRPDECRSRIADAYAHRLAGAGNAGVVPTHGVHSGGMRR